MISYKHYRWLVVFALIVLLTPILAACGAEAPGEAPQQNAQATEADAPAAEGTAVDAPTSQEIETAPAEDSAPTAAATEAEAGATPGADTEPDIEETEAPLDPVEGTPASLGTAEPAGGDIGFSQEQCPQQGGTAVVTIQQEPEILDPYITSMTFAIWVLKTLDVPMTRAVPASGQFQPMLLTEVPSLENGGISEDGKTYTLNFKEGLKWSDGEPLDATDLVFTWKTIMDPNYGAGSQQGWDQIQDIKLSNNDRTATITLKEVYAPFASFVYLGYPNSGAGHLLPEHVFEGMQPNQYAQSDFGAPGKAGHVGTGPFKISEWRQGQSITVERNENYVGQQACLDRMIFQVVPSVDTQVSMLQRGENDLATNFYGSDIPTLENLEPQGVKVLSYPAFLVERYVFNFKDPADPQTATDPLKAKPHPLFQDKNVRLAVAHAINRQAIVDKLLHGNAEVAVTEWDNSPWFNENLKPYEFNPDRAKQLLEEAGWTDTNGDGIREKNGQRATFTHSTTSGNPIREQIQRAAINDLRNVGIEMKVQNVEPSKFFGSYSTGGTLSRHQFGIGGYTTGFGTDPDFSTYYACDQIPRRGNPAGSNYGAYCNEELDKLWQQQARELDPAKRKEIYDQIQQIMYDDVAILWIYDRFQIDAAGPNLQTPPPDFTGYIWWGPEFWSHKGQQ